jgi:hypothetical protein
MINNSFVFSNGATTIYSGLSSDELIDFSGPSDLNGYQFNSNRLLSNNSYINSYFWSCAYSYIFEANSIISGIAASTSSLLHDSVRIECIGEAKFIRAFCYFYLTNLFGNIPLPLTADFNQTALMASTVQSQVYQQILDDLLAAQTALAGDFSAGQGQRVRPNKWAATAMLARVYLYQEDWSDAITQASTIIANSSLFSLETLSNVFNANSNEAIWQLEQNNMYPNTYNGTLEGFNFIPVSSAAPPNFCLSPQLNNSFESGDSRYATWVGIDSTSTPGQINYYPNKYTVSNSQKQSGGPIPQYYMVLRLAEQYLIRAEAEAHLGSSNISLAIGDLNTIRSRAGGIPLLSSTLTQTQVISGVSHERQIELFAEWGHRWLDLKRTNTAISELSPIPMKIGFTSNALLYPIPLTEIETDPNLTQNLGY